MARITIATYTNKKGEERVSLLFPREFATEVAYGDAAACLQEIREKLTARIIKEDERDELGEEPSA